MAKFLKDKRIIPIILLLALTVAPKILALETAWPQSPVGTVLSNESDVGDMVKYFYEWAIVIGGIATFISLVSGGFKYLSSAGNPNIIKESREQMGSAVMGLVLLLSSWLILNTINPDLTTFRKSSYNLNYQIEQAKQFSIGRLPSCDYVLLYSQENFRGDPLEIPGKGGSIKLEELDGYKYIEDFSLKPLSIKAWINSTSTLLPFCTSTPCECIGHACGCILQLFAKDEETGKECGDKLGDVLAWDKAFTAYESGGDEGGQAISCIRIRGTSCQCRKVVDGNCTSEPVDDTGWGDNVNNCVGDNDEMNNKRCYNGKCVTCEGFIHTDSCSGCAGTAGPEGNEACWYQGGESESCDKACQDHGAKCVQADWGNYDCAVCQHWHPSKGCSLDASALQWYYVYPAYDPNWWGGLCGWDGSIEPAEQLCDGPWWTLSRQCICTF
jgi:hypothetical protein